MRQSSQAAQKAARDQRQLETTIGIDLGDRWSRYCVLDSSGAVTEEDRVRTTVDAMRAKFGTLRAARIVIEAGTHSPWVKRVLEEHGHEVIVANARKVRLIYESDRKNDRLDARMLAKVGRLDVSLLAPVWHRSAEAQADLAVIRSRNALVAARTQLINAVRAMVKNTGARLPKCTTAVFAEKMGSLVPPELKAAVAPLLKSIRALSEQIHSYDQRVEHLAEKKYPETRLLQQVKGVGPLIALTYVLTVEDPSRFRRSRQMGCFFGLRPRQRESGESSPQLGISKCGDGHLRWLLVQAANYMPFFARVALIHQPRTSREEHPMRNSRQHILILAALLSLTMTTVAQDRGFVSGRVVDSSGAVLKGARIQFQPGGTTTVSDASGEFSVTNLPGGTYDVTVSYVGFSPFHTSVTVPRGGGARVEATMKVASDYMEIVVTAERPHGEAEAINRMRAADNLLQVLPSEVITSLPNANIADALGRLPSVTIERDEGEGKYVQIRGTEPRLSNVTIDGINVPSPESGVRQIKLDTVASDLVESVEINKTLQANQDGDGIGGSVNMRTKNAADTPVVSLFGIGGYTPIISGRGVDQFGGTASRRFGSQKKLGLLFGGTYDWNGRGINDVEPSPTVGSIAPHYDGIDIRDYQYYRSRWGYAGSADYKLNEMSMLYLHGLFSQFRNWGDKWVYSLNDGDVPSASVEKRTPDYAIGSLVLGGHHVFRSSWLGWDLSVARSRQLSPSGNGSASFSWNGGATNCFDDPANTPDVYRPQFSASCFTPGSTNVLDISNYKLKRFQLPSTGESPQLNLQGSADFGKDYHLASRHSTFAFGFKVRNGHKFDDGYRETFNVAKGVPAIPVAQFAGTFSDSGYYDNSYPFAAKNVDYNQLKRFVLSNPTLFTTSGIGLNPADYNLVERVTAGYLMNTVDLSSRVRLITGVRFEATHLNTVSFNQNTSALDYKAGGDYMDVLPSASLRIATSKDGGLRLVYSRALARPDPQDIAQSVSPIDDTVNPHTVSLGNPNLKAEHANNVDVLYEHYLTPLGMIQAGFFYKNLTDPITTVETRPTTGPFAGFRVTQPGNAGTASLAGFELAYQQRLTFLPGVLRGSGISANYSYTTSQANNVDPSRSDSPALLRQAPNTWNISPTYDTRRFSVRVGMTFNDAMIYQYQWSDGADPVAGIHGPAGDIYLYKHFQVDAQGSVQLAKGFSLVAYGLNLNNEVFGFYNGSPQYVLQREYYKPTIAAGIRWTSAGER